ncbi:MAG: ClpXP protease specificity-enhancing factor [Acidithiobacillus sp.]
MLGSTMVLPESAKPHLLQAIYAWCLEQDLTPYLLVLVDYPGVSVPPGYDRDGRIVLDISPSATQGLQMADSWIQFQARFGGVARRIEIPMAAVLAIYAAETQEGMGFPEPSLPQTPEPDSSPDSGSRGGHGERPGLRVIK